MYKLKQIPEDFIVKELSNVDIKDKGKYLYFRLKKKSRNTLDVIKELARQLKIKEKDIGFAGSKDKHAVTEQLISVFGNNKINEEKVMKTKIDNVSLELLGSGDNPISLGDLEGNEFEIVVRDLDDFKAEKIKFVENYFDEQRFSLNNAEIGRNLVKKNFKEAAALIDNLNVREYLLKYKNDFVGALKIIPLRLLRMYVNSYQSYLWNEAVAEYLKQKIAAKKKGSKEKAVKDKEKVAREIDYSLGKFVFVEKPENFVKEPGNLEIPLIGFTEINADSKIRKIIENIMKKENISYSDFVIKQIPELSLEGSLRRVFVEVKGLEINEGNDELNKGRKKLLIKFSLPKGSYATIVVKRIIP